MEERQKWGEVSKFANSIVVKIIFLVLVVALPLNGMLLLVTKNSMDTLENQTIYSNQTTLNTFMTRLDSDLRAADTFLFGMIDSGVNFWKLMQAKGEDERKLAEFNLHSQFEQQIFLDERIAGLFWYREDEPVLLSMRRSYLSDQKNLESYLVEEGNERANDGWYLFELPGGGRYLGHIIKAYNAYVGGLVSVDEIIDELTADFEYHDKIVFIGEAIPKMEGKDAICISAATGLNNSDFLCGVMLSRREILEKLPWLQKTNYYIAVFLLLLIPVYFWIIKKILIDPLRRINRAMQKIKMDNIRYRIAPRRSSTEFEVIDETFNSMMEEIRRLKIEKYEKQIEKQKLEVKNLQLQVRPHFLLNTFHLIYSLAQVKDYAAIQDMVLYLTKFYREGIRKNDDFWSIKRELEFVDNYLNICHMRYPDCFVCEKIVSENLLSQRIPSMLIYNFVENSIVHVVKMGSFVTIRIAIMLESTQLKIVIEDDGMGIAPEIMEQIQNRQAVQKRGEKHIGILNCRKRLEMIYGAEAQLEIRTAESEGTEVHIRIPLEKTDGEKVVGGK